VGFLAGGSLFAFAGFVVMGFVIEGLSVVRTNQEKILYHLKKMNLSDRNR
jgi:hypothetical protein